MAYDDKGWPVFPTRTGGAIGSAQERTMLDVVGGAGGIRTQIRTLPDGSTVRLKTRNGMPEFVRDTTTIATEISKLFLDNGFVTPGFSAPTATLDEAQPIAISGTGETTSTYAAVLASKIDVTPTSFPNSFLSFSTSSYGDVLKIKNAAITVCPPAMFTGLMRRYVSAIYGKKLKDALDRDLSVTNGACPTLTYDGVTLNPGQTTTGIVFSLALKRYWMVSIGGNSMTYVPLTISSAGQKILDKITAVGGSALNKAYHSYVLSTARVTTVAGNVAWQDGGSFADVLGTPLNFGWRFNSDGTRFAAVAIDQYGDYISDSRLYEGEISISGEGGLSVSVAVTEEVTGWRSNRIKLFYPLSPSDYMWKRTGSVDEAVSNAPLLAFYDDNDTLKVARYSRTLGETEELKTLVLSGLWTYKQYGWLQIPAGVTSPVAGPCGDLTYPTYVTTCGQGDFGYEYLHTAEGDGASLTLGDISLTERVITEHEVYSCTMTPAGDYYLAATAQPVYDGDSIPGDPTLVNGSLSCGTAYYPEHGEVAYYNHYYLLTGGSSTQARSTLGEAITATAIFVAPQDCATAWYEGCFESKYYSPVTTIDYDIPGQQSTQKYVGPETLICETGANHGGRTATSNVTSETEYVGTTRLRCVTSYGADFDVAIGSEELPSAYKFFGATISAPVVSASATVREDQSGNTACENLETEEIEYFGWPETGIRSVGWQ